MYPYIYKRISDRYIFILILLTCLGSQAPDPGFAVSAVCVTAQHSVIRAAHLYDVASLCFSFCLVAARWLIDCLEGPA